MGQPRFMRTNYPFLHRGTFFFLTLTAGILNFPYVSFGKSLPEQKVSRKVISIKPTLTLGVDAICDHKIDCHLNLNPKQGHVDAVSSAVFSKDRTKVLTASWDHTAKIWDMKNQRVLLTLGKDSVCQKKGCLHNKDPQKGHTSMLHFATFSPDETKVLTTVTNGIIKIWDTKTGKLLHTFDGIESGVKQNPPLSLSHVDVVMSAVFSPDGKFILTASWDRTSKIWDSETGTVLLTLGKAPICFKGKDEQCQYNEDPRLGHTQIINSSRFSPDGKLVVTASQDNTSKIWDARTGRLLLTLGIDPVCNQGTCKKNSDGRRGHLFPVNSASFSPDGTRIVTASMDGSSKVWDVKTGNVLLTLGLDQICPETQCPEGEVCKGCLQSINPQLGHLSAVEFAAFSPDGAKIVTASKDGTSKVWNGATGKLLLTLGADGVCKASPPFVEGEEDNIWSQETKKKILTYIDSLGDVIFCRNSQNPRLGHVKSVLTATWSSDQKMIITASKDGTSKIWQLPK